MALEAKQGMSKLEQVCEEITEADRLKQQKRDQKKQRRKARKKNKSAAECGEAEGEGKGPLSLEHSHSGEAEEEGQVGHKCQQEGRGEGKCVVRYECVALRLNLEASSVTQPWRQGTRTLCVNAENCN